MNNTVDETPVEIDLCVKNNRISVAHTHHLDDPRVEESLKGLEGPSVANLGHRCEEQLIVAKLRISCKHSLGLQASTQKKILAAKLRPIKLNAVKESNGYMVGLMADTHTLLFGSMKQLNEGLSKKQFRSDIKWNKGHCVRFEFIVGTQLRKVLLNLASIKRHIF